MSDPTGGTHLNTFENGARISDGQIALRRFDPAIVTPPGVSKNLNLFVRQDLAQIPPRAIVQLILDGQAVFWGPAIITPPLTAPGAGPADTDRDALERVTVTGGEQLLRDSIVGTRFIETNTDVADIAREFCERYAHPALTIAPANFPATGSVLSVFYAPEKDLLSALQQLAESVPGGATVWVDATGSVRFEVN